MQIGYRNYKTGKQKRKAVIMKHLLDIKSLKNEEILEIVELAKYYEKEVPKGEHKRKKRGSVALLFFENSTRTRFSFEMASKKLGLSVFNFEAQKSSILKGEGFFDTLNNLNAIGCDIAVIRHSKEGFIEEMSSHNYSYGLSLVNAGEGKSTHPTQALLDFYTMQKHLGSLEGKKIVIVGDIVHSRVAKSNIELLNRFGANVVCCSPSYFEDWTLMNIKYEPNIDIALKDADVVMCLRIQKERIEQNIPYGQYIKDYQINENNLPKNALLMHPGPVNRDVEISSSLLDSPRGEVVIEQARNGVFVRMAALDVVLEGAKRW